MRDRYERAERLLPQNAESLVRNDEVNPHWIDGMDRFWYRRDTGDGSEFVRVDPETNSQVPAFDHDRLAGSLAQRLGKEYKPTDLPFERFEYVDESTIRFTVSDADYECDLETYECTRVEDDEPDGIESPDGKWVAFVDDHDLYVRNTEQNERVRLTADGQENYDYATPLPSPTEMVEQGTEDIEQAIEIRWSSDSRRLMTYRLDCRSANQFTLVQSNPNDQPWPKQFTYPYPLPGERGVPVAEPMVFDVERRTRTAVEVDPVPLLTIRGGPLFDWADDDERLYYFHRSRDRTRARLLEVDATSGETRTLATDEAETVVDPHMSTATPVDGGSEVVLSSERSGRHHLYLVDGETVETTRITSGEWVVRDVVRVDDDDRCVYFTASGREPDDDDPYLRRLYRVDFDGSDLTLLTPESADHSVDLSPSGEYVVDTYSTVDDPPTTVLRDGDDGAVVRTLEEADATDLFSTEWEPPEPFETTAADGETDLFGLLWKPSDFDPSEEYPVVEQIYTGPHDFHVPKTFDAYRSTAQSVAELGFVVVMVDGRGTGRRSRAFRDHSYCNLSRAGVEDHRAAIERLAEERPFVDGSRVGIYGHSAGGYDSTHALLRHPDVYDVAVSSAGNHDHRLDKAWWNELWMGLPVDDHYREQSNPALADRLEGDLLLVHGELDDNVHPAATLRLVDELMRANKDFDMLVVPNRHHDLSDHPYFVRARWDYLVEHLHDDDPPEEYDVTSYRDR